MNYYEKNRRYGRQHRNHRAGWAQRVNAGGVSCCRCGQPILPGAEFHLDHNDDGPGYKGAAHPVCNVSANEGGWRGKREHRANPTDDELYCGIADAPIGMISSNGLMVKHDGGGWRPIWVQEMYWNDAS